MKAFSRPLSKRWIRALGATAAIAAAALLLLPTSPAVQAAPGRDGGAFLLVADGILDGSTPYIDLWDHKGPVLYLWNAVGRIVPLPGLWGPWVLRLALLAGAIAALGATLARRFGGAGAVFGGAVAASAYPYLIEDGLFTEEIAVAAGAIALWLRRGRDRAGAGSMFAVGGLAAAVFLIRQNLVGTIAAVALVDALVLARRRGIAAGLRATFAATAGAAAVCGAVLGWVATRGALAAWWTATFTYNRVYASGALTDGMATTARRVLADPMLALLALAAFAGALAGLHAPDRDARAVAAVAALALPIEFVAASLSGNAYLHYFVPWLVPIAVLAAAGGARAAGPAPSTGAGGRWRGIRVAAAAIALVAIVGLGTAHWNARLEPSESGVRAASVAAYLAGSTAPGETVWVWGAEASVNLLSGRDAPRPYFYAYPLLRVGFGRYRDVPGFVARLVADPPARIVDTSATNGLIPPLDPAARRRWRSPDPGYDASDLDPLFEFVERRYRPGALLGRPRPWVVYVPDAP